MKQADSSSSTVSMKIKSNFIVCGRGQRIYNTLGNKNFRSVVATYLEAYMSAPTRRGAKSKIIDETLILLKKNNMEFVEQSMDKRGWRTLSDEKARKKVAHSFRDLSRKARQCANRESGRSPSNLSDSEDNSSLSSSACSFDDAADVQQPSAFPYTETVSMDDSKSVNNDSSHCGNAADVDFFDIDCPMPKHPEGSLYDKPGELTKDHELIVETSCVRQPNQPDHCEASVLSAFEQSQTAVFHRKFGHRAHEESLEDDDDCFSLSGVESPEELEAIVAKYKL